jgi:hypothetical protein
MPSAYAADLVVASVLARAALAVLLDVRATPGQVDGAHLAVGLHGSPLRSVDPDAPDSLSSTLQRYGVGRTLLLVDTTAPRRDARRVLRLLDLMNRARPIVVARVPLPDHGENRILGLLAASVHSWAATAVRADGAGIIFAHEDLRNQLAQHPRTTLLGSRKK